MAARTPTSFNAYNDLSGIVPNREILASNHNAWLNDQQFCLDRGECLCSFANMELNTYAAAWETLFRLSVRGRDLCGTAGSASEAVDFCIRARCTTNNDYIVGIYDPIAAAWCGMTITANRTTWKWRGWTVDVGSSLTMATDGSVSELLVGAYIPNPGTGYVLVSGVGIFAPAL
jgi:hypothetical protein